MGEAPRIQVPHELFAPAESSYFSGRYDLPVLHAGPDSYTFSQPLDWQVALTNTGGALLLVGSIEGVATVSCARCLDEFSFPVKGEIEGYYLLSDSEDAPEDMDEDEFEVLSSDNTIELHPLLNAALLLEFPLIPLCKEDCKGLCTSCGENLNKGVCECSYTEKDFSEDANPFAVLKEITFEDDTDRKLDSSS